MKTEEQAGNSQRRLEIPGKVVGRGRSQRWTEMDGGTDALPDVQTCR